MVHESHLKHRLVACLGDSITYGWPCQEGSYPSFLGNTFGDKWEVANYGLPGATAATVSFKPYLTSREFAKSLENCADIGVLMLGTNDVLGRLKLEEFRLGLRSIVLKYMNSCRP